MARVKYDNADRPHLWNPSDEWEGPGTYNSDSEVWDAARGYFDWCDRNGIRGKPRAYTVRGLCIYMGISMEAWTIYRENFPESTKMVDQIIYEQKFTHAAVDIFNATLIARDLGMMDRTINLSAGTVTMNDEELDKEIKALIGDVGKSEQS